MAHVLNRPERNQAFWKFLFFFLLSTALIVGAVYFPVQIPTKNNEMLREQVSRYKAQASAQDKVVKEMKSIKGLFDSLNNPSLSVTSQTFYSSQINKKIIDLNILQDKDSSMYSQLNKNVADVYLRYLETTNTSIASIAVRKELEECKANREKAETELEKARQDLEMYRRTAPGTGF